MTDTRFMLGRRDQLMKNPAISSQMAVAATTAQGGELALQCLHALQTSLDTGQLRINQLVDIAAIAFRMRNKRQ